MSTTAATAPKKTDVPTDRNTSGQISADVGRIQVSGTRFRRFYVFAARRLFAGSPQKTKIHITALGSAITSAIGIAHELVEMNVATITDVQTFYQPLKSSEIETQSVNPEHASANGRSIARILIVIERKSSWTPEDSDLGKPIRRTTEAAPAPAPAKN